MVKSNETILFCGVDAVTKHLFTPQLKALAKELEPNKRWEDVLMSTHYWRDNHPSDKGDVRCIESMIKSGIRIITTCKQSHALYVKILLMDNVRIYDLSERII